MDTQRCVPQNNVKIVDKDKFNRNERTLNFSECPYTEFCGCRLIFFLGAFEIENNRGANNSSTITRCFN